MALQIEDVEKLLQVPFEQAPLPINSWRKYSCRFQKSDRKLIEFICINANKCNRTFTVVFLQQCKNAEKYAKKERRFFEKNCARWRGKTNPPMMVLTLPSNKMMIIEQKVQQAEENEKFGCWPNQFTL